MGIQGLERYLTVVHPTTCPTVNVADLVTKYRAETGREEAVAVVDGGILVFHLMARYDSRYGGQFKEFVEELKAFASHLQAVGVTPVFYFKGAPSEGRLNLWRERKEKDFCRVLAAYESFGGPRDGDAAEGQNEVREETKSGAAPGAIGNKGNKETGGVAAQVAVSHEKAAVGCEEVLNEGCREDAVPAAVDRGTTRAAGGADVAAETAGDVTAALDGPAPTAEGQPSRRPDEQEVEVRGDVGDAGKGVERLHLSADDHADGSRPSSSWRGRGGRGGASDRSDPHRGYHRGGAGSGSVRLPQGPGEGRGRGFQRGGGGRGRGAQQQQSGVRAHNYLLPAGTYECAQLALKTAGYEVLVSLGEADVEMVRYARSTAAFCILSRDTDFVAMEGAHYYLSLSHLKRSEQGALTTVCFDRDAIAGALGLSHRGQLPLLLALMPNGCVPAAYLLPLHHLAARGRVETLRAGLYYRLEQVVDRLGSLVRGELWELAAADAVQAVLTRALAPYPPEVLNRYARQLKFADRWGLREALRVQLEASLRAFDYTPPRGPALPPPPAGADIEDQDLEVLIVARARHRTVRFATPAVLGLLTRRVVEQSPVLEDPALPAGCGTAAVLRPFRRRVYGALLRNEVQRGAKGADATEASLAEAAARLVVREFLVPSDLPRGNKLQPVDVEAVVPDPAVLPRPPGVLALWRGDEAVVPWQWRLLAWSLCPSAVASVSARSPGSAVVSPLADRLQALPRRLALPAAALFLLQHSGALKEALTAAAATAAATLTPTPESRDFQPASDAPCQPAAGDAGTEAAPQKDDTPVSPPEMGSAAADGPSPQQGAAIRQQQQPAGKAPLSEIEWARLLARTCVLAGNLSAADVAALPTPPLQHRMAVHVASVFMKAWSYLVVLNDILGAPVPIQELQPADAFDGKLFHCLESETAVPHECDNSLVEAMLLIAFSPVAAETEICPTCCSPEKQNAASRRIVMMAPEE